MTRELYKEVVVSGSLSHGYGAREWNLLTVEERKSAINNAISQLDDVSRLSASPDDVIESALTLRFLLAFRNLAAQRGVHISHGRSMEMVDRALEYFYDNMKAVTAS